MSAVSAPFHEAPTSRAVPQTGPIKPEVASTPRRYEWLSLTPFILVHVLPILSIWVGVTWQAVAFGIASYWVRMFFVTAGYHRYFSHRTFKLNRFWQFVFAFGAQTSAQRGALWWASHHRHHHKNSDQPGDTHSPRQDGFWYSHMMWIYNHNSDTDMSRIKDLTKFPELVWLDKYWWAPPWALGVFSVVVFGWSGLLFGFFLSTVFLWHGTFTINSLSHVFGTRRFQTTDDSRNNPWLAFITMGEGWHNNHHHYQASCRQGFYRHEIDLTYMALKAMSWVGIVKGIKEPPERVLEEGRRADAARD